MKNLILISLFIIAIIPLSAQTEKKTSRTFQLSFISPMGTNGIESPQIDNTVSLNILAGVNGGVRAFEMGALMNWNQGSVRGFQIAGITNVVRGSTTGAQIGGIYNFSEDNQTGVQIGGIATRRNIGPFQGGAGQPTPHKGVFVFNGPTSRDFSARGNPQLESNEQVFVERRSFCVIYLESLVEWEEASKSDHAAKAKLWEAIFATNGLLQVKP